MTIMILINTMKQISIGMSRMITKIIIIKNRINNNKITLIIMILKKSVIKISLQNKNINLQDIGKRATLITRNNNNNMNKVIIVQINKLNKCTLQRGIPIKKK